MASSSCYTRECRVLACGGFSEVIGDLVYQCDFVLIPHHRGLTGGFLLLRIFSIAFSVSPHICFILVLILISMFLR